MKKDQFDTHYIPFSKNEIIKMVLADAKDNIDVKKLEKISKMMSSIYHFEFLETLEMLKKYYEPFDPDSLNQDIKLDDQALKVLEGNFISKLDFASQRANYKKTDKEEIIKAMEAEGAFPISMEVNFENYEYFYMYSLGKTKETFKRKSLFVNEEFVSDVYGNVIFIFKPKSKKSSLNFLKKFISKFKPTNKFLNATMSDDKIYVKQLRKVPSADMEILFPDAKPIMKLEDKLKISIPMISGIGLLIWKFVVNPFILGNKDSLQTGSTAVLTAIAVALYGYAQKTLNKYKIKVLDITNDINSHLYFKSLVSNKHVFTSLIDFAEEEEFKEAILGYYFLLKSENGLNEKDLDKTVEGWFKSQFNVTLDFEVSDSLKKLLKLNLVTQDKDIFKPIDLDSAIKQLNDIWNNSFIND